ncbi:MAG: hypothetical protein QM692_04515 [Thermomicrobiales bacterium]
MLSHLTFPDPLRHNEYRSPFQRGADERPLRLFIDSHHLTHPLAASLLDEFATHPLLKVWPTHRDNRECFVLTRTDNDVLHVRFDTVTGWESTGVPFVSQWEAFSQNPPLRDGVVLPFGPWQEPSFRLQQYLLAQVAANIRADIFVTDDPFLLEYDRVAVHRINVLSSSDAIALLASFLRSRGDFNCRISGSFTSMLGRGGFYWGLTRALLPSSWHWFSAGSTADGPVADLTQIAQTALTRTEQALKARDNVHWLVLQPHNNETADDVLFYFDAFLLMLLGAFDAIAALAGTIIPPPSRASASWNNAGWLHALRKDRDFCHVVLCLAPGSTSGDSFRLLTLLRNTIHGPALDTIAVQHGLSSRNRENFLALPHAELPTLRHLIKQVGGYEAWGYDELPGYHALVRPGAAVEHLTTAALGAINEIMQRFPVERLPGLPPDSVFMAGPPEERSWDTETRDRIMLLGGF